MQGLNKRLEEFSVRVIRFCRIYQKDYILRPLLTQLIRSGTSIGANYAEAQSGISRKEFRSKIYIALKEAEETKYWLTVISADKPSDNSTLELQHEVLEIVKILQTISNKLSDVGRTS